MKRIEQTSASATRSSSCTKTGLAQGKLPFLELDLLLLASRQLLAP